MIIVEKFRLRLDMTDYIGFDINFRDPETGEIVENCLAFENVLIGRVRNNGSIFECAIPYEGRWNTEWNLDKNFVIKYRKSTWLYEETWCDPSRINKPRGNFSLFYLLYF